MRLKTLELQACQEVWALPAGSVSPRDSGNAILESGWVGTTERHFLRGSLKSFGVILVSGRGWHGRQG